MLSGKNANPDQLWKCFCGCVNMDKLLKSSSSMGKYDSVTIPRSTMCWVSITGKSKCLRAPWAHIPNFPLCQKLYEKPIHPATFHLFPFCKILTLPPPHLQNPLTLLAHFPEPMMRFIKGEYWFGGDLVCISWKYSSTSFNFVQGICDKQSMNKIRSPYISNFFLQVKKGKWKKRALSLNIVSSVIPDWTHADNHLATQKATS